MLDALAAVVGASPVVTDPATVAPHLVEPRKLYAGTPTEVAAVLRHCGRPPRKRLLDPSAILNPGKVADPSA